MMQLCVVAFILSYCFLQVTMFPILLGSCYFIDGFVKEGALVTCVCEDNDPEIIEVFWDSSNPDIVAGLSHQPKIATLEKIFTRNYDMATIDCVSVSNETSYNNSRVIRMAYGPDVMFMAVETSSNDIDVCSNCSNFLVVKCQPSNSVPSAVLSIYMNETLVAKSNWTNITQIDQGGPLNISCVGKNSEFQDLFATASSLLLVREVPTSAPLMTIDGSQSTVTTVVEGLHQIVCRVDGGYPMVDNVTVQCGGQAPLTRQGEVTSMFNITRELSPPNCSCWASHVTGYYNQRTIIRLIVQYVPQIIAFTINNMTAAQSLSKGNSVLFACQAVGNPEPGLEMISSNSNTTLIIERSPLSFEKELQCNDSSMYTCQADNALGRTARSIPITVLCVSPTPPSDPTTIIVAIVVPVVVVVAILTVVAVIICRRTSRSKAPAPTDQLRHSPLNDYTVSGTHLSGSYTHLQRVSQDSLHPYGNMNNPGNSSVQGEGKMKRNKVYTRMQVPKGASTPSSVQTRSDTSAEITSPMSNANIHGTEGDKPAQIEESQPPDIREGSKESDYETFRVSESSTTPNPVQASSDTGIEIIPPTPSANRHKNISKVEESQPPDIPEKTNHRNVTPWKSESKLDDISPSSGQTRSPRVEHIKPPPIPTKPSGVYVNVPLKPVREHTT